MRWQYRYKFVKEFLRYERIKIFGRSSQEGSKTNRLLRAVANFHLKQSLAGRPDLLEKLTPDHAFGAKRPIASDAYYPALRQENVLIAAAAAQFEGGTLPVTAASVDAGGAIPVAMSAPTSSGGVGFAAPFSSSIS